MSSATVAATSNSSSLEGRLHYSARSGDAESCSKLIQMRADIFATDKVSVIFFLHSQLRLFFGMKGGNTALHHATFGGSLEAVQLILTSAFEKASFSNSGFTSETPTTQMGAAAVNCPNNDNNTPLFYACTASHVPIIRLLLSYGADSSVRNSSGLLPIDWYKFDVKSDFSQQWS